MEPNVAIESTPQVWCESIQELCESLTYFRSYQSGLYASNGIAIALLLNADEVERECFNWDVIITHGGGSMMMAAKGGKAQSKYKLHRSQKDTDNSIAPLISSYLAAKPIAVILGPKVNKNVIRNKHPFSVLGWYTITHLWSEYDLGLTKGESKRKYFVRKKIRLQHIPQQPYKKWWQLDACPVHVDREFLHLHCRCQTRLCKQCDKISPLVYEDGFICMNEECQRFWMLEMGEGILQAPNKRMGFNNCFIYSDRNHIEKHFQEPFSLLPTLNSESILKINHMAVEISRGIHCLTCGKLSSREEWFGWSCRSCKVWKQFDFGPLGLSDVLDPFERVYTGFRVENGLLFINPESGIQLAERINKNNQTSLHYYLPNLGEITHFLGSSTDKKRAENIFNAYQRRGPNQVNFKRYAFHIAKVQRRFLGNQFQFNSGEQYDHALITETTLLEASPPPIKEALEFIEERISHNNFNQVSSLLYMQGQRMDWHDDGEEVVVGPVATFTMGSKAQMWFREKSKSKNGKRTISLKLILSHGDVLVMWNKVVQRNYEHCIKPEGFRIGNTSFSTILTSSCNCKKNEKAISRRKIKKTKSLATINNKQGHLVERARIFWA